jgi:hypothetical protein
MATQPSSQEQMRPNAGRVYDYLLGGHHNFEVDRQAAEQVKALLPYLPTIMRLQRWCLQDIAEELVEQGFDTFVDFASGMPTEDHIHEIAPPETLVIYSDNDPLVVEYGLEILKDTPNAHMFLADARRPEELLNKPEVVSLLEGRKNIALVYWGVPFFIADEDLAHAMQYLYEWAGEHAENTIMAFNAQVADANVKSERSQRAIAIYRERMHSPLYFRPLSLYKELIKPWKPNEKGFIRLTDWHGIDITKDISEEDLSDLGEGLGGYGAYLVR